MSNIGNGHNDTCMTHSKSCFSLYILGYIKRCEGQLSEYGYKEALFDLKRSVKYLK